jgi:hypothetical protein
MPRPDHELRVPVLVVESLRQPDREAESKNREDHDRRAAGQDAAAAAFGELRGSVTLLS